MAEPTAVGTAIRNARKAKKMTLSRVADKAGGQITASTIGQIERGEIKKPSQDALKLIAEALGVSFQSLQSKVPQTGTAQNKRGKFTAKKLERLTGRVLDLVKQVEDLTNRVEALEYEFE